MVEDGSALRVGSALEDGSVLRVPSALREEGSACEGGSALALRVGSALDEREGEAGSGNCCLPEGMVP